ncbi:MAG: VCBS repeat-containing protein [Bacteroidota bacterium]
MASNLKFGVTSYLSFFLFSCANNSSDPFPPENTAPSIFEEITEGRIATDGGLSRGVAWGDYDGDGDSDLYVSNSNGQWNALYRNNGNGSFKKMTESGFEIKMFSELVRHGGSAQGANRVDYDNDGDLDLFVVGRDDEPNFLFNNIDNLGFVRITDHPLTEEGIRASMACWADIEGDGDLDVFVVASGKGPNRVYKNLGGGTLSFWRNTHLQQGRAVHVPVRAAMPMEMVYLSCMWPMLRLPTRIT